MDEVKERDAFGESVGRRLRLGSIWPSSLYLFTIWWNVKYVSCIYFVVRPMWLFFQSKFTSFSKWGCWSDRFVSKRTGFENIYSESTKSVRNIHQNPNQKETFFDSLHIVPISCGELWDSDSYFSTLSFISDRLVHFDQLLGISHAWPFQSQPEEIVYSFILRTKKYKKCKNSQGPFFFRNRRRS